LKKSGPAQAAGAPFRRQEPEKLTLLQCLVRVSAVVARIAADQVNYLVLEDADQPGLELRPVAEVLRF
jgi:hypothetical protein